MEITDFPLSVLDQIGREDIEEYLDLPLLGVVISEDSNNSLIHKR